MNPPLLLIFVCILGYALLELLGGFDFSSFSEPVRKILGRTGMVIAYLSALIASLSFYWDGKAQGIAARSNETMRQSEGAMRLLQRLGVELGHSFDSELTKCKQQIAEAEADLCETSQYLSTKTWLGWVALVGVVIGTFFQLIGAN